MKRKITALILVFCIVLAFAAPCAMAAEGDVLLRLAIASKQKEVSELVIEGSEIAENYAVSTDGTDVPSNKRWITQTLMDNLTRQVAIAREFITAYTINGDSTGAEMNAYLTQINTISKALSASVSNAKNAARYGTEGKTGLDNFKNINTYTQGQFTDVSADNIFAANIKKAYELGLLKGREVNYFDINGGVTVAEAVAMAARLHSIYNTGSSDFEEGTVWYQVYADYAVDKGLMSAGQFDNYARPATRAQFAQLFAAALPDSALEAINTVADGAIPDVPSSANYYAAVYKLYRAGVLTGNDAQGTFLPDTGITRGEAAALMTRMADTSLRKTISL